MKKEDIEKAAGDYSGSSLGFADNNSVMAKHKAFADGAEWRIDSVWHDASECPRRNTWYIAQIGDSAFDTFADSKNWVNYARGINIIRWAYIEELLPNTEE